MSFSCRPLVAALALVFTVTAQAAHPAKVSKPAAAAPVPVALPDVALTHNFGGVATQEPQKLVDQFNETHKDVGRIHLARPEFGGKPAALNILRRTEVALALANKQAFKPLHAVMSDAKEKLPANPVAPDLRAGVLDEKGRLVALPVAYSTPVLFYNKAAFRKAGLDPETPPATWMDVQNASGKLLASGLTCAYTTSWPVWVHIDNVSALSGVPVATPRGDLAFNGLPMVKHVAKLASWAKSGYFTVFGRHNEADQHFKEGECGMITTDSWAHTDFRDAKGVELGVAPLPHYDDLPGGRQHTLADGPSLWVGAGFQAAEYRVAAKFISYLLTPETQIALARVYGHLPLTQTARAALKTKVLRDRDQTLEVAYASLKGEGASHPLRIASVESVRIILEQELEAVWADTQAPKGALDVAVTRGNALLGAKPALKKALPF